MKGFFARMSFPRAVILLCSLGSLVFGFLVYQRSQRLDEVKLELKRVPDVTKDIQTDAFRLADMLKLASNEQFKKQSDSESYIRGIATDTKISVGQLAIDRTTRSSGKNIDDYIYKITPDPQVKNPRFTRGQIGNFLYTLEQKSRRFKVTRIKLTPCDKILPGDIGKDAWKFDVDLTTRIKTETAPPSKEG